MNKTTSFLFAVAMAFSAMSQTVDLRFTGQLSGGSFVCLDSVKVENITRAWSETLVYPDTVLSFTNVGINDVQGGVSSLSAYPNPMGGLTTVSMSLAQSGTVIISVYDLSGRSVAWHSAFLEAGAYAFNVSLEAQQVYLLAVATPTGRQTLKLVNTHGGSSNAVSNLIFTGVAVAKGVTTRPFGMGDAMKYTGYATFDRRKLKSAAKHQRQDGSEDITLVFDEASVMPQGALTGVFSVSQNGRVHFSSGNLQWSATGGMMSTTTHTVAGAGTADGTWRFAPNQWDVIGESNANISSSYNGWIDLFGWGTSGYGNKHPYLIEQRPAFYVNGVNSISGTNYDWGVFNAISNGGDAPDLWRTLTFDEMQYLLFYRHTLSGIIFAKATLENTAGLVLFPDNWDSTAFAINNANDGGADFSVNNIVQSDWISILEPAGCVFLPAAGYRYGTQINDVGVSGNVWLSTYYDERDAHSLRFTGTGMRSFGNFRYCGGSVRLVCDETAILPIVTTDSISNLDDHSARTGGNVVSDGGTPVTERGVCWSTSPNPTIFGNHTTNGTGTGAFTISLSGLSANTVYYLRAYATNRVGTSYGQQMVFTTLDIPTVTTAAMSTIIDTTATGGGRVTFDGNTTVTARGVCWDTTHNPTISGNHTTNGGGTGSFTSILTQLVPSTTYYVRAYATNIIGTAYGAELSFTTLALPSVSTTMASNVSDSGATSGGRVTNDGGTPVTARGVCWSTSQYPTVADSHTIDGSGTGIFTSLLPRLIPGTTYYVRAYATNAIGTSYGAQVNFTTLSMPIVVTVDTNDITDTSLTVSGRVNSEGGLSVTA
ncbi:MAG: T9SS type A sorting domain-containing protein [Bacteroidales bacterium]|nr:T9SS type A sorting domain-containing protein [Bacteroidales bacterium]